MAINNENIPAEDVVIWLSQNDENHQSTQSKLHAIVFHNCDECVDYMTDINDRKIVLIVSDRYAEHVLSVMNESEHLKAIYVLHCNGDSNINWSNTYTKVKGTFNNVASLATNVSYYQRISDERVSFTILNSAANESTVSNISSLASVRTDRTLKSHNITFMYFHLLVEILLKMSNSSDSLSKQDLINHFRHVYHGQPELATIDEFERDYSSENAIWWYTRNTFLYRVLNDALRKSDFDTLFALRFFIADLYKQLTVEHDRFRTDYASNSENSSVLKVYRGQSISNEELILLRQSQNGFFSMQSFLSTSMTSAIGQFFAESNTQPTDTLVRIVYEFNIDTRLTNTKPFAKINHLSYFQGEDEVLLALGSIFRINSVQFDDINQRWQAELTLCDDENFDLYGLMNQYAAEIVSDRVSPGFLLYQLGNYVKANEYFQKLMSDRYLTNREKAHCYRGLGTVAAETHDFDKAYKNFEKELELWVRLDDEENVMEAYKNIGNMLFYKEKYEEALEHLQITAMYFRSNDNVMEYVRIYGMIAQIMGVLKRWDDCLMCYSEQLEVRQRELDPNHEDIGITHANLGATYHFMGKYEEAINHFQKALDIYRHSLQSDHPNILKVEENLHNSTLALNQRQSS